MIIEDDHVIDFLNNCQKDSKNQSNLTQKNDYMINLSIHELIKLITSDLASRISDRDMKNRNYVINSVSTKLLFFIISTKSMFIELCLISIILLFFLFIMIIVECMNNVSSFLIFISKSNRIFNKCLVILVGIICHALY